MDRKNKIIFLLSFFFVASTTLAQAGLFAKKPKASHEIPPRPVETAIAATKDTPRYIDSFGNMASIIDVNIQSQVTGQIESVHFIEGQDVAKGDLLFVIDPRSYKAQLQKAEAALAADTADLELKKITLERNKKLLERELISQQDYDKYKTDADAGQAQVDLDKASVDLAKINLDYCYITSPADGRTSKRFVDPGNIVPANTGPTLVNIKTIDTLYVDFTVTEIELDNIRKAMAEGTLNVLIAPEETQDYSHSAELKFLDNKVDNTTGTILLRAIAQNKDRSLWSGQFVNIRLVLGIDKDSVVVPYETVQLGQDGPYAFVVDAQGKADLRMVATGLRCGDDIVVKNGLAAGEKVVTVGQMGLWPGAPLIDVTQKKENKQ